MMTDRIRFYAVLMTLPLFLYGCSQSQEGQPAGIGSENNAKEFSAPFSEQLQKNTFGDLEAKLDIEGIGTFDLDVDLDGTGDCASIGVCGTIMDTPEGNYQFTIRYLINSLEVARSVTTGTVTSTTSFTLNFPTVTYADSDGDGFTNLAELESGFDPLQASSRPPAETPRFSTRYILVDSIGQAFMTTENITSPSYTIKPSL